MPDLELQTQGHALKARIRTPPIGKVCRECLTISIDRRLRLTDVIDLLSETVFASRGVLDQVRSDNARSSWKSGAEPDLSRRRQDDLHRAGQPMGNRYCEIHDARPCDQLLDGEIFCSLALNKVALGSWRRYCNKKGPHSCLSYRRPAPELVQCPKPPFGRGPSVTRRLYPDRSCTNTEPGPLDQGRLGVDQDAKLMFVECACCVEHSNPVTSQSWGCQPERLL